ncbi:hypothetical protein HRbin24_01469 [bacterium HR24]|jgi:S1-C subfamily serine protease|nr:hypothetical protein HRbin24_01469 [bacterium HR24]
MRVLLWLLVLAMAGMVGLLAVLALEPAPPPLPEMEVVLPGRQGNGTPTAPAASPTPPSEPTAFALDLLSSNTAIIEATSPLGRGSLVQVARGTGLVVRLLPDGYVILTAAHVLDPGTSVRARRVAARIWCDGEMVSNYQGVDVAVLYCRFDDPGGLPQLPEPSLVHGVSGYEGRTVLFRCHFDDAPRVGHVTGQALSPSGTPLVITDIPAEPGCSGSALLDAAGNVIAVVIGSDRERGTALASVLPQGLNP